MGETLYLHFLIVTAKDSAKEQEVIDKVLSWSPDPVGIPPDLVAGLTPGIAQPGPLFHTSRPFQVAFLIEFAEQWKEQGPSEQRRILGDPWKFKDFVMGLEFRTAMMEEYADKPLAQREALFHLVFPDSFEAIVSLDHKQRIAKGFSNLVTQPTDDIDRQLHQIRQSLEDRYEGGDHFFYRPEIRVQWDDSVKPWDEFVRRAQVYVDSGRLETEEIEYKVRTGRKLAAASTAVLNESDGWGRLG